MRRTIVAEPICREMTVFEVVGSGAVRDPRPDALAVGVAPREPERASPAGVLAMLARRWRTVTIAIAAAVAVSLAYVVLSPPHYTASTSILLATGSRPTSIERQLKAIGSEPVLGPVVDQQRLVDDPEFGASAPGVRERLLALVGLGRATHPDQDRRSMAVDALGRAVGLRRMERAYALDVTSREAVKAAYLADAIAKALLEDRKASRSRSSEADRPGTRIAELRTRLLHAEAKVQAYKQANGVLGADGAPVDERQLAALDADLARAKARTVETRAAFDRVQRPLRSDGVPESTGDAPTSATLDRLLTQHADIARQEATDRATLGERHPAYIQVQAQLRDSRRQIIDELRRLSASAGDRLRSARADEEQLARQVEDATRLATTASQASARLRELQRVVDAARADYDRAMLDAAGVAVELPRDRIVAVADVPIEPSSPDRLTILAVSAVCGLFFGVGAAALRDRRTHSRVPKAPTAVRNARISRRDADALALIGAIPEMRSLRMVRFGRSRHDAWQAPAFRALHGLSDDPGSPFSAAVRRLYDSLRSGSQTGRAKVVLVTSDDAGAGKSTIAVNLIRAASERGERALLIEGNPDNPQLLELVDADAAPTLIELADTTRLSFAVGAGIGGSFQLVPIVDGEDDEVCRLRKEGVPTLVGIKDHFDFVVIDGPTIGADETASVVAEAVDQVVLVMPQTARPDMVEAAMGRLQVPAWKFRGTVLSKVDDERIAA